MLNIPSMPKKWKNVGKILKKYALVSQLSTFADVDKTRSQKEKEILEDKEKLPATNTAAYKRIAKLIVEVVYQ